MLKCGQCDNKKYTFGIRKEQMEEPKKETQICCLSCGTCFIKGIKVCPSCGREM